MGNETTKLKSQLDLVSAGRMVHEFITLVNQYPRLYTPAVIRNSIRRYEEFWLPLAGKHADKRLAAPLDVEWVWQVHMLNPVAYEADCIALTGYPIDHKILALEERSKCLSLTKYMWNQSYPGELFHQDPNGSIPPYDGKWESSLSIDLYEAVLKERIFNYQVLMPHYQDEKFLKEAVKRYFVMMLIKKERPDIPCVPYIDTDLIWHAHLLHPRLYKKDTVEIFGSVLERDDKISARIPNVRILSCMPEIRKLWVAKGKSIAVSGGMFRGEPSYVVEDRALDRYRGYSHKTFYLQPKEIVFPKIARGLYRFSVICEAKNKENDFCVFENQFQVVGEGWSKYFDADRDEARFVLNTDMFLGFAFTLRKMQGDAVMESFSRRVRFPPPPSVSSDSNEFTLPLELRFGEEMLGTPTIRTLGRTPKVHAMFTLLSRAVHQGSYCFGVAPAREGFFKVDHMAMALQQPPLIIPFHIQQDVLPCFFSECNISSSLGDPAFSGRITHCLKPRVSVVDIIDIFGKHVASGHMIDSGALPEPSQVTNTSICCTLVPQTQRAMLIHSENRDWGIIRAAWTSFVKYVDPGYMVAEFFPLAMQRQSWITIHAESNNKTKFAIDLTQQGMGKVSFDLEAGTVSFPGNICFVPELLCFGLCLSVLFILSQPRSPPPRDKEGNTVPYSTKAKKTYKLNLDEMPLILAAGLYSPSLPRTYEQY